MFRRLLIVSVVAFVLNFLWEEAHAVLYLHYKGEAITHLTVLRCAFFDAFVITLFSYPFLRFEQYRKKHWLYIIALTVFAVGLEKWALGTGRWVYTDAMPLIPLLHTGLTPTIQLGLLGLIAFRIGLFSKY